MSNISYPEWMLDYEFGKNYLGLKPNDNNINRYEYDQNNFFIENISIFGNRNFELRLLMNPKINFDYINIVEISYVKDDNKIYLVKNKKILNKGKRYIALPEIKYIKFKEYFVDMEIGEKKNILISQIYQFDNGSIITEKGQYTLLCFEQKYSPLYIIYPFFSR